MNETIYHYTDINALKGMIDLQEFWLTAHSYMNDEREFHEGLDIIKQLLAKKLENEDFDVNTLLKNIFSYVEDSIIFSTSFSKKGDLLSQWRSYCPKEGGVAIGFDRKMIERSIQDRSENENLRYLDDCCYDKKHSESVAEYIADGAVNNLKKDANSPIRGKILKGSVFFEMLTFLARTKNEYFIEEEEVRLFTYNNKNLETVEIHDVCNSPSSKIVKKENVNFRTKHNYLVPYIKVKFPIEAIKSIRIGPSEYQELCLESLKMFLVSKRLEQCCRLEKSDIPYRAL